MLRRNVPHARPVLESLLTGRIALTPHMASTTCAPIFNVRIPLTNRGIVEEICCPNGVASPAGSDERCNLKFQALRPKIAV